MHHGGIDEAGMLALGRLEPLAAKAMIVEVVDVVYAGHGDPLPVTLVQFPQLLVEVLGSEVEATMEYHTGLRHRLAAVGPVLQMLRRSWGGWPR